MKFTDLGLNQQLVETITALGFTEPTAIQQRAIPILLKGETDFIGLAQTGTGKTAAFGLPLIQRIAVNKKNTQALILCPTRELCSQIVKELKRFADDIPGISIVGIVGGMNMTEQIRALRQGAHIVVGTPGRLIDHLDRRTLNLENVEVCVLDEADEMLDMGFHDDIKKILGMIKAERNIWLFSATMSSDIETIANVFMKNPEKVTIGSRNSGASTITHYYTVVDGRSLYAALRRFIVFYPELLGILFCRTRSDAKNLAAKLVQEGCSADALHGDLSQGQRDAVMSRFRNGQLQLLIATDVAARGLDIEGVTHVFHYSIPDDIENYTHRAGRTGRAGKLGSSIAFITPRDMRKVKMIERQINAKMVHLPVPQADEIGKQQINHFLAAMQATKYDETALKPYIDLALDTCKDMSKEDILRQFIAMQCRNLERLAEHKGDLNAQANGSASQSSGRGMRRDGDEQSSYRYGSAGRANGAERLFINLGMVDGIDKRSFLELVQAEASVSAASIGSISLKNTATFFDVTDKESAQAIIQALDGSSYQGRQVRVNQADRSSGGNDFGGGRRRSSSSYHERGGRQSRRFSGASRS